MLQFYSIGPFSDLARAPIDSVHRTGATLSTGRAGGVRPAVAASMGYVAMQKITAQAFDVCHVGGHKHLKMTWFAPVFGMPEKMLAQRLCEV